MTKRKPPPKEKGFQPGQSGNPGGKPVGSRNRLQGDFLRALAEDFEAHGKAAIVECRTAKPDAYLKVVASLMPKEVDVRRVTDDLTDDQLAAIVDSLRAGLEAEGVIQPGAGLGPATAAQQPRKLPSIQ